MDMDESVIYQLTATIKELMKEIVKLRADIEDLRQAVNKNTSELGNR